MGDFSSRQSGEKTRTLVIHFDKKWTEEKDLLSENFCFLKNISCKHIGVNSLSKIFDPYKEGQRIIKKNIIIDYIV